MSYSSNIPHEYLYPDGPPTPEEEEEAWARAVGYRDGREGCIEEEGKAALSGEGFVRRAYIRNYHEGFLDRKIDEGDITRDEWDFYDPYPGRWGRYYWEV